jgi:enterobactin synthetase component D
MDPAPITVMGRGTAGETLAAAALVRPAALPLLLPPGVHGRAVRYEARVGPVRSGPVELLDVPTEAGRAADRRVVDLLAGRHCAHGALADAGVRVARIGTGAHREPMWPGGWVGSITHGGGFAAAVVAPVEGVAGIGIDFELVEPAAADEAHAAETAMLPGERALQRESALAELDRGAYATLLFSAKESVFKCLYPTVGAYFDFAAFEVVGALARWGDGQAVGELEGRLTAGLAAGLPAGHVLRVAFVVEAGRVFTLTSLARDRGPTR